MVVTVLDPVFPHVVLEVLGPRVCFWIVREHGLHDVLMLELMVIHMLQDMHAVTEVSEGNVIGAKEFRLVLLKVLLDLLEASWQLLGNV